MNEYSFVVKAWLLISERFPYCKYCPKQYNNKETLFNHIINEHAEEIANDWWYKKTFELTDKEIFRLGQIEAICYKNCKCLCHESKFRKFIREKLGDLNCKVCGHMLDDFLRDKDCKHKEHV